MPEWVVEPPTRSDFEPWRQLYRGYATFYEVDQTEEQAAVVWGWINDAHHQVRFLDDLFVAVPHRGSGAVDALLTELRRIAAVEGWDTVRWITADNNYRARSKYDQVATRTTWITYDMAPDTA